MTQETAMSETMAAPRHGGKSRTLDDALATLGVRVAKRRRVLKLSLQDVADRAQMSKAHIWEIEKGRAVNPTVRALYAIAEALGWTLSEAIGLWEHADLLSEEAMQIAVQVDGAIKRALAAKEPGQ